MIILIPAYEPDDRLVRLIEALALQQPQFRVVVVDDGSGPDAQDTFHRVASLGCTVLHHDSNRGKGNALKTGFSHISDTHPGEGVVCADSDGQHSPHDIVRVAEQVSDADGMLLVLGSRGFTGEVPARSRLGNAITGMMFQLISGRRLADTQTGLRGYTSEMLPWLLTVQGNRFEYELRILLSAVRQNIPITEVTIATIYLAGNESSHFRPIVDSVRVCFPLLLFGISSVLAFLIDTVLLLVLNALTGTLLCAVVGARVVSSAVNFAINRRVVFEHGRARNVRSAAVQYSALVVILLCANYGLLTALTEVGVPLLIAKLVTESLLFSVSYIAQGKIIFTNHDAGIPMGASAPNGVRGS